MLKLVRDMKAEHAFLKRHAAHFLEIGDSKDELVSFFTEWLDEKFEFKKDRKGRMAEWATDIVIDMVVEPAIRGMMDPEKRRAFLDAIEKK